MTVVVNVSPGFVTVICDPGTVIVVDNITVVVMEFPGIVIVVPDPGTVIVAVT